MSTVSTVKPSGSLVYNSQLHSKYISAYGNAYGPSRYLIAVQLKQPVQTSPLSNTGNPRCHRVPENAIVLLKHFPVEEDSKSLSTSLVFTVRFSLPGAVRIEKPDVKSMLETFFPPLSLLLAVYYKGTLFTVTNFNPFKEDLARNRKDAVYHTLVQLVQTVDLRTVSTQLTGTTVLPIQLLGRFRYFRRNLCRKTFRSKVEIYSSWYPLASILYKNSFIHHFETIPSSTFARKIFKIHNRLSHYEAVWYSRDPSAKTTMKRFVEELQAIPPDFYTCEVSLDDKCLVGVMGIVNTMPPTAAKCEYLSPMVVAKFDHQFSDVNQRKCNMWLPLFRNPLIFRDEALRFYLLGGGDLQLNVLKLMLNHLEERWRIDKFKYMRADLRIVYDILGGGDGT